MKIFGWGYVKDFCVSLFQKEQQEKAITYYCAECLRILTENTAKLCGGAYVQRKLYDVLEDRPAETRDPDEIIETIRKKLAE